MKKFLNLLFITSFAALPLFAIDDETKLAEGPKEEVTTDVVIAIEAPKDQVVIDETPAVDNQKSDEVKQNDDDDADDEEVDAEVNA